MTKTAIEVIALAGQRLGVVRLSETPPGDMVLFAMPLLQSIVDVLNDTHAAEITWTIDAVPDELFVSMADALAACMAPALGVNAPVPKSRAMMLLRASLHPDDRPLRGDYDDDGTVSEGEAEALAQARYY